MMTKKHYEAFAASLKASMPGDTQARIGWMSAVLAVADVCAVDNPRFRREQFLDAAEYYGS